MTGSSPYQKLAMLVEFKNGLGSAGYTDTFVRALGAVDESVAEIFIALPSSLSMPIDEKWLKLPKWFSGTEKRESVISSLLEDSPDEFVDALIEYQESPLRLSMENAHDAIRLWRWKFYRYEPPETDQEQLGKNIIERYFGAALSAEVSDYVLAGAKNELLRAAYKYIDDHYEELCPSEP